MQLTLRQCTDNDHARCYQAFQLGYDAENVEQADPIKVKIDSFSEENVLSDISDQLPMTRFGVEYKKAT